jgi:hypothetical protein
VAVKLFWNSRMGKNIILCYIKPILGAFSFYDHPNNTASRRSNRVVDLFNGSIVSGSVSLRLLKMNKPDIVRFIESES